MDEEYNNTTPEQNSSTDESVQNGSDYGSYMPPPPQDNGYGNNPPPQNNGYGNYPPPQQYNGYGNNPPPPQNNGYGNYPPPQQYNGYGNNPPPPQQNNGYGNYPPPQQYNGYGNYPPPPQNGYGYPNNGRYVPPVRSAVPQKSNGLAIAGMVTALANLIMFNGLLGFITVPVALILTILAVKRKSGNKVLYIISIAASAISTLIFAAYVYYAVNIWPEAKYFMDNRTQIMDEYERTGRIPERFEKFNESKYTPLWHLLGFESFDDLFDDLSEIHENSRDKNDRREYTPEITRPSEEGTTSAPDDDEPYDDEPYDYDHSGEDLVVLG